MEKERESTNMLLYSLLTSCTWCMVYYHLSLLLQFYIYILWGKYSSDSILCIKILHHKARFTCLPLVVARQHIV